MSGAALGGHLAYFLKPLPIVAPLDVEAGAVGFAGRVPSAAEAGGPSATLHLKFKPGLSADQLMHKVLQRRPSTSLPNVMANALHLPAPVPTLPPPGVTPPEGPALAALLAALPLPISGLQPLAEAISTAGGIPFSELTEELMLRRRPGIFVAGQMLEWEAPTGGYLLQGCFSSGAWAAQALAKHVGRAN